MFLILLYVVLILMRPSMVQVSWIFPLRFRSRATKLSLLRDLQNASLSGVPDYFGRNKISSAGDLSHYSSASLY